VRVVARASEFNSVRFWISWPSAFPGLLVPCSHNCKLLDCSRIVAFKLGEDPPLDATKEKRGKYKTRKDKVFCSHGHAALYSYRKKAGWPRYV